ncbi:MAG: CIA30 family protein [Planctomycetota bacterium]
MLPLLLSTIAFVAPQDAAGSAVTLSEVVDFSSEDEAKRWITVNDNVMGGRSRGGPAFSEDKLIFSGATNTNGGGFSSIRTKPQSWPLQGAEGLRLRVRGDGRTYKMDAGTTAKLSGFRVAYRTDFKTKKDEWIEVDVPFSAFEPSLMGRSVAGRVPKLAADDIRTLGFMIYDGKDGPFELQVDSIRAYRPAK